ncbi:hypothetical protein [Streptomyces sp. AK02-01A]|uniref:hypothetical protein n=1 Tax=Streptomyces sp. AK02-01A TaxID=3028648 RepID=UPI0029B59BAD|nr:hypothetical protein [Streptomyces sp. AK02-01A]MDX3851755.1 hypothetical protein [Streptomyces sp. AK02-01A]
MNGGERREAAVRRMLEAPRPAVPADLARRATARGTRLLHRRRVARRLWWFLLFAAVTAFAVWASVAQPWSAPPAETTPPLEGW